MFLFFFFWTTNSLKSWWRIWWKNPNLFVFAVGKLFFSFKIKFLVFLNRFDVSISKINFKIYKKYYFNIFSSKEHFKNTIDIAIPKSLSRNKESYVCDHELKKLWAEDKEWGTLCHETFVIWEWANCFSLYCVKNKTHFLIFATNMKAKGCGFCF